MKILYSTLIVILYLNSFIYAQDSNYEDKITENSVDSKLGSYNANYYELKEIYDATAKDSLSGNLQTPYKTLTFFERNAKKENYELAAAALNLNLIPENERAGNRTELAKQLYYVLNDKGLIQYDDLPNRPDGVIEPPLGQASKMEGVPRKSILLGKIKYDNKNVPIYLERIRINQHPPIWVFSAETVEYIEPLYHNYKPPKIAENLPPFLHRKVWRITLWEIIVFILAIALAYTLSWIFMKGIRKIINNYTEKDINSEEVKGISIDDNPIFYFLDVITLPFIFLLVSLFLYLSSQGLISYVGNIANSLQRIISIGFAICLTWFTITLIDFGTSLYIQHGIQPSDDGAFTQLENEKKTNVAIGAKIIKAVAVLWALIFITNLFLDVSGLGRVLLTSAGILSIILGFAAQSVIGNFIAGIQVAITKPVKIGDVIVIKGEWSTVEDLRYTYAVIKTWDSRRLIVPMKYLIEETIENWSHSKMNTSSGIYFSIDYTADIESIREHFKKLVNDHPLRNKDEEPKVLVTNSGENTITIRCVVSSDTPNNAWEMECDIREKMLAYFNKHKEILPRERHIIFSRNDR